MSRNTRQTLNMGEKEYCVFPPKNVKPKKRKRTCNSNILLNTGLTSLQGAIPEKFIKNYAGEFRPKKASKSYISRAMIVQIAKKYILFLNERIISLEDGKL